MKLLFITQKVDRADDVLGFVHTWITHLAQHWEAITVVCLYEGEHNLPENVRVLSLGKERGASRIKYIARLFTYIWKERAQYERVFVHMNPEYVVLAGWFWKLLNKPIALWYVHKSLNAKLRFALLFVDLVFTSTAKSVSFSSPKLRFVGHGIDIEQYRCDNRLAPDVFTMVSVGRITQIKNCGVLLGAARVLRETYQKPFKVVFVGKAVTEDDRTYQEGLERYVAEHDLQSYVTFTGSVSLEELRSWYCRADIVVNMVPTGGLDKAGIEPMAAGTLAMSSNEAFKEYYGPYANRLYFTFGESKELAEKLIALYQAPDREIVRTYLYEQAEQFDVTALMKNLSTQLQEL